MSMSNLLDSIKSDEVLLYVRIYRTHTVIIDLKTKTEDFVNGLAKDFGLSGAYEIMFSDGWILDEEKTLKECGVKGAIELILLEKPKKML